MGNVFVAKNLNRAASAALVCNLAQKALLEIFGKEFCEKIAVTSFKDEVLYLGTDSPTYAQEIKMREAEIIDTLSKLLNKKLVEKIKFRPNKTPGV